MYYILNRTCLYLIVRVLTYYDLSLNIVYHQSYQSATWCQVYLYDVVATISSSSPLIIWLSLGVYHNDIPDINYAEDKAIYNQIKLYNTTHIFLMQPPKKQPATSDSIPAWQWDIACVIQEMETYSNTDLVQIDVVDKGDADKLNATIKHEETCISAIAL